MKTIVFALSLLAVSGAFAADTEATIGPADCKVINPHPVPNETVKWSGPCRDGYAHGAGVLEWFVDGASGSYFKGTLERGVMHGTGYLKSADGSQYEGGFVRDQPEGKGKLTHADGQVVKADFVGGAAVNGKAGCKVINSYPVPRQTVRWSGACKDGYADGAGTLDWFVNGELTLHFEGTLKLGRKHGNGYTRDAAMTEYEGGFLDDQRHGKGIMQKVDFTRYEGEWKENREEGTGLLKHATGGHYQGQWKAGRFHGSGKATYTSGKVVEGQFIDGLPAGQPPVKAPAPWQNHKLRGDPGLGTLLKRVIASNAPRYTQVPPPSVDGQKSRLHSIA